MTMKKILMAAVAVSAISAGTANAASFTGASIGPVSVVSNSYRLAKEAIVTTSAPLAAATQGSVLTLTSGKLTTGSYLVSYSLTGPAYYTSTLTSGALTANGSAQTVGGVTTTCSPSIVLSTGGVSTSEIKDKTVSFIVNLDASCNSTTGPNEFTLAAPISVTAVEDVSLTGGVTTGGIAVDGGTATKSLITAAQGFKVEAAADTLLPTVFALDGTPVYSSLKPNTANVSDDVIGRFTVAPVVYASNPTVWLNLLGTLGGGDVTNTAAGANLAAKVRVTGDLAALKVASNTTNLTPSSDKLYAEAATVAMGAEQSIKVSNVDVALTASQSAKDYSLTVTPKTSSSLFTPPAAVTLLPLQTVGLEGTSLLAPWVAGEEQANFSTSIRLVNGGSSKVGAITLALRAPVTLKSGADISLVTTPCTSTKLDKLKEILPNTELTLSKADFKTCFGSFKRADVLIVVQGANTNLSAKMRNVDSLTSANSEISLGGLKQTGLSY